VSLNHLVQGPRWAALSRFVQRWYAEPLGDEVVTRDDLARAEARIGSKLNVALREWFLLVGHRLQFCGQDIPKRIDELEVRDGRIVIWAENQGCWHAEVEVNKPSTDPTVLMTLGGQGGRNDRLERVLLGLVCSDTLIAVWAGNTEGPLGALRPGVVGGYPQDTTPDIQARIEALPVLDAPNTPLYDGPFRGHESLVIRASGGGWEWMAADDEAHAEARRLLALDEVGALRRLVVLFDPLPACARPAMQRWLDARSPLDGAGAFVTGTLMPGLTRAWLEFDTHDPRSTLAALLAQLPAEAGAAARAGHRPEHTTRFVPCWPPGLGEFALPPNKDRYL